MKIVSNVIQFILSVIFCVFMFTSMPMVVDIIGQLPIATIVAIVILYICTIGLILSSIAGIFLDKALNVEIISIVNIFLILLFCLFINYSKNIWIGLGLIVLLILNISNALFHMNKANE